MVWDVEQPVPDNPNQIIVDEQIYKWIINAGGYCVNGVSDNAATTTNGQTIYIGGIFAIPTTTAGNRRLYLPRDGNIKAATVWALAGTAGSNESWSAYVRVNNTTDYLIEALSSNATNRLWANYTLNTAVYKGDYIEIKFVNPTWGTNPANVLFGFSVYVG